MHAKRNGAQYSYLFACRSSNCTSSQVFYFATVTEKAVTIILVAGATLGVMAGVFYYFKTTRGAASRREYTTTAYEESASEPSQLVTGF